MRTYALPDHLREALAKPLGKLMRKRVDVSRLQEGMRMLVTVGDATAESLISMDLIPDVQVVDARERRLERESVAPAHTSEIRIKNPAGKISEDALKAVRRAFKLKKPVRIIVEGEEDLLALPFLATYPIATRVLYGQPGEGMVLVEVGEEKRKLALSILREMKVPKRLLNLLQ